MKITLVSDAKSLPALTNDGLARVQELERELLKQVQFPAKVDHAFHAGVYARSMLMPAGMLLTGALMRIPTLLIVSGELEIFDGSDRRWFTGYNILCGDAGRKSVILAVTEVSLTMVFATQVKTVDAAEREFTDEYERLQTRKGYP